jgi:hypothetical protein
MRSSNHKDISTRQITATLKPPVCKHHDTQAFFLEKLPMQELISMSLANLPTETQTLPIQVQAVPSESKQKQIQEILDSLRSLADEIGQINELTSEEKLVVAQFFSSLLKLMQPFTSAIAVTPSALPPEFGNPTQAHIVPTGHLAATFSDGNFKLIDLADSKNLDFLISIIPDLMPKLKSLITAQKTKVENRIAFLSIVTKEMQRSSDTLSAVMSGSEK